MVRSYPQGAFGVKQIVLYLHAARYSPSFLSIWRQDGRSFVHLRQEIVNHGDGVPRPAASPRPMLSQEFRTRAPNGTAV
jgi:hypothetical protein